VIYLNISEIFIYTLHVNYIIGDRGMFKRGRWIGERLRCPYCKKTFKPIKFSDPLIKQCPHCHRYFYYQKVAVGGSKKEKNE